MSTMPQPSSTATEDADLLYRVADGDKEALSALYDRYVRLLLGVARRVLGDEAEAEEVLQDAFFQVWSQAKRYDRAKSSVSTWLVLITRSRAIDRLRSRHVKDRTLSHLEQEKRNVHTSPQGARNVLQSERQERLRRELLALPDEQRRVLELAFFSGMTQSEIATDTGIPLGTVKTRTLLAMKKLRHALQQDIGELL